MAIYVKENNKVVDIFANVDGDKKRLSLCGLIRMAYRQKCFPV